MKNTLKIRLFFLAISFSIMSCKKADVKTDEKPTVNGKVTKTAQIKKLEKTIDKTFKKHAIILLGVDSTEDKPIYQVSFTNDTRRDTYPYLTEVVHELAPVLSYSDFILEGTVKNDYGEICTVTVSAECDTASKSVNAILVNNFNIHADSLVAYEEKVIAYTEQSIDEIQSWKKGLADLKDGSTFTIFVEHTANPLDTDSLMRKYYMVYVGVSQDDHASVWEHIFVSKDCDTIFVSNIDGAPVSLEAWRSSELYRGYMK